MADPVREAGADAKATVGASAGARSLSVEITEDHRVSLTLVSPDGDTHTQTFTPEEANHLARELFDRAKFAAYLKEKKERA